MSFAGKSFACIGRRRIAPEAKPYNKLYEFFAQDIDGNYFRVFYDFAWEEK